MKERFKNPENWQKNIDPEGKKINLKKLRLDVSDLLGQELTPQETRCYLFICNSGVEPINQENLYFKLTGVQVKNRSLAIDFNGVIVSRIREKLGDDAVLTIENEGYISRRSWIENMDFNNPPKQKLSEKVRKIQKTKWGQRRKVQGSIGAEGTLLSPREKDVLEVMKTGQTSSKEIAIVLSINYQTVKNHLNSIYKNLGITGKKGSLKRNRALVKAILLGEIEPFKPSIDQKNTPIFKLGAFHQKKTPDTTS